MSSFLASALILILFLLIAAPAVLAVLRHSLGWRTTAFYSVLLLALLGYHLGFSFGPMPSAETLTAARMRSDAPRTACEQVLEAAERGRLILDRSRPGRVMVSREAWGQVPQEVRAAIEQCATPPPNPGGEAGRVQIIQR